MIYEILKSHLAKNDKQLTPLQCAIASGVTRFITAWMFYPFEVLRMQIQRDSVARYVMQLHQQVLL